MTGSLARAANAALLAIAAAALSLGSWAVPLARSAGGIEILREDLVLSVSPGSLTICNGEKATISVTLETETTYRDPNDPASTLRTMRRPSGLAAVVRVAADDPGVAAVSPQFAPAIPPGGAARFTLQGGNPGRTILRVSETQNGGYRAQEIQVIVDECFYLVDLRSNWKYAAGFQPDMTSISVATEVKATSTPGQLAGNGTSQNIAIAVPVSACIPTVKVSDGQIRMKGVVADGVLTLDIEYNPVVATMHVVCIRPQGDTTDIATPRPLQIKAPAYQDSRHTEVHILDAFGGVPGLTWVTIHLVRIPS